MSTTTQPSSKFRKAAVLAFQDIQAIQKVLEEFDVVPDNDNASKLNFSSFSRIPNSARSNQNSIDSISTKSMLEDVITINRNDSAPGDNLYETRLPFESPFNLMDSNKYQIASSNPPSLNSLSRLDFPLSDKIESRKQKTLETDTSQNLLFSKFENKSQDTSKLNIDYNNLTEQGYSTKSQASLIPQNIFIKTYTTPNADGDEFSSFYNTTSIENKDEILKRAKEDFEKVLKSQRKASFDNFKNMLKIGSEAYIKEKELEFERNTLPKDPAAITRHLVDFIVRQATEIFHSENQFSEHGDNNNIQNQSFQNTSFNYAISNSNQNNINNSTQIHLNPTNSYFQNTTHHQNNPHEDYECELPQQLQMKITQNLEEHKQQLLSELATLLHQEARSALHEAQRKIKARKKYWVDLTNKDKQAAHQLRLQELQFEMKFPVSNFSQQYQYPLQPTSSTNSHTDWGGDTSNNTYHNVNHMSDAVDAEEEEAAAAAARGLRVGRTRWTPGPGPAHAQSKTLENINGRVYLDRARRGNEVILMNLEHSLEKILETSYPSGYTGYTQKTSTRSISTDLPKLQEDEDDDDEVFAYAGDGPMPGPVRRTLPASNMTAVGDLIYEKVSTTRHLMLQMELRLQKQQTLHHRLTVEAEALKNISSKETLKLLNEIFDNLN